MTQLKGFKFVATLVLVIKKIERDDKTFYSHWKAETMISENDSDDVFESFIMELQGFQSVLKY